MAKPAKKKKHHLTKDSTQSEVDAAWTDAVNTATHQPDTCVIVTFDKGKYSVPAMANGSIWIIGDDLVTGDGGVIMSVYTDTETGIVHVDYDPVLPVPGG